MHELFLINSKLDCLTEVVTVRTYNNIIKPLLEGNNSSSEKFCDKTPITNFDELFIVEQWLEDRGNYKIMMEEISRIGGSNLAHSVRNILYRILTNEMAEFYSWDGAKQKRPFKHLHIAKGILDMLKNLITTVEKLSQNVQYLVIMNQLKNNETVVDSDDVPFSTTYEELQELNASLENEDQFKTLCHKLSLVGGKDVGACTRKILTKLVSHQLSIQLNWSGRNDKCGFVQLENVRKVIVASVRRNPNSKDGTVHEIEQNIKVWLRGAGDRDGGRTRRKYTCSPR